MKKTMLIAAAAASMLLASCASTTGSTEAKNENTETKTEASMNQYGISNERYQELLDMSLVSVGNTARMKKVISKLQAGEKVYVAALGGSVTEGAGPANYKDGYAYQFNNKLKAEYCADGGKNVYFDGAGLSGTPSQLGIVRYESDVVQVLGANPDLLIIEFAVNDDGSEQSTRAFEALVRNALIANEDCAVIALYSAATYGNTAAAKKSVAEYYGIPQVNVLTSVKAAVAAKDFTQAQYYTDSVHPTKEGHEFQADCIMNMIKKSVAAEEEAAVAVPENWCKAKPLTNFTRIVGDDDNVKITKGGFNGTDSNTQSLKKTNKGDFPQNWHHAGGNNESFVMKINCKSLIFTYKNQGSWLSQKFGKAEVYVDGKLVDTYDGGPAGGWNDCVPKFIIDNEAAADHTVEVKMAAGDESKGFTIVAMGYSK